MRKQRFKFILPVFIMVSLLVGALTVKSAMAMDYREGNTNIEYGEIITSDLYLSGEKIDIAGAVNGDLFAGGDTVDVSGNIYEDAYLSGGVIDVSGEIGKSLYISGGQINISGNVARNVIVAGGIVTITEDASVWEDVIVAGGQVTIKGNVFDDVRVAGGEVEVTGEVAGDVLAAGGQVDVDEDKVSGEVKIDEGNNYGVNYSSTFSNIDYERLNVVGREATIAAFFVNLFSKLLWFIGMYIVGVLLIKLAPVKTDTIVKKISGSWRDFGFSFLIGFVAVFVLPLLILVLTVLIVGIPVALFILCVYLFVLMFGGLWADMAVGSAFSKLVGIKNNNYYLSLLFGRVLRFIIKYIPCVNSLYGGLLFMVTVGAVIRAKRDMFTPLVSDNKSSGKTISAKAVNSSKKKKTSVKKKK